MKLRPLSSSETALIEHMLRSCTLATTPHGMRQEWLVEELNDGSMGSIRFHSKDAEGRQLGADLCQLTFPDADGVPVVATLSLDNFGQLFELDIWKTDFSAVQRFPLSLADGSF
ncbi:DUF6984 family protein [Paraburkholderia tropica]|uniref:DUF6984 family protein n=1 Tax=Paraburkholderia tropica TaxID=92647 RepID=UPI003F561B28